jgi:hypothetical protein
VNFKDEPRNGPLSPRQSLELMDTFAWHQFSPFLIRLLLLMFLADGGGNFK